MKYSITKSNLLKSKNKDLSKSIRTKDSNDNPLLELIKDNLGCLGIWLFLFVMVGFLFLLKQCEQSTTVDTYLSKYNFEKARKAAQDLPDGPTSMWSGNVTNRNFEESDKAKALYLIIGQEAAFYIQNKQYEKALQTADELFSLFSEYQDTPDPDQAYDDIVSKIVNALIRETNYDYAKKITVSFKSDQEREAALERIKQIESQK